MRSIEIGHGGIQGGNEKDWKTNRPGRPSWRLHKSKGSRRSNTGGNGAEGFPRKKAGTYPEKPGEGSVGRES